MEDDITSEKSTKQNCWVLGQNRQIVTPVSQSVKDTPVHRGASLLKRYTRYNTKNIAPSEYNHTLRAKRATSEAPRLFLYKISEIEREREKYQKFLFFENKRKHCEKKHRNPNVKVTKITYPLCVSLTGVTSGCIEFWQWNKFVKKSAKFL